MNLAKHRPGLVTALIVAVIILMYAAVMLAEGEPISRVVAVVVIGSVAAGVGLWFFVYVLRGGDKHDTSTDISSKSLSEKIAGAKWRMIACVWVAAVVLAINLRRILAPSRSNDSAVGIGQILVFVPILLFYAIRFYNTLKLEKIDGRGKDFV